jgi:FMN-dependent NADH-azoreductase
VNLLHLDASARTRSFSRDLSARYATAWRAAHPSGAYRYRYRDLAADPPPVITESWTEICDQLMADGITEIHRYPEAVRTPGQRAAWAVIEPLLGELVAADTVLIGAPMYNYSVPAALKLWIDQVTFPRMSLAGRRFVVAGARGGAYGPGAPKAPYDHHERYLRDFFAGHFGVEDVEFVTAELTNSLVDPLLANRRSDQRASYETAVARIEAL